MNLNKRSISTLGAIALSIGLGGACRPEDGEDLLREEVKWKSFLTSLSSPGSNILTAELCSSDQLQALDEATQIVKDSKEDILEALYGEDADKAPGRDVTSRILDEVGSHHAFCPTKNISYAIQGETYEVMGRASASIRIDLDGKGVTEYPPAAFNEGLIFGRPCSLSGIQAHETAHVVTGWRHPLDSNGVPENDWVYELGEIVEKICWNQAMNDEITGFLRDLKNKTK